ncbi:hypothetical protein MMC28_010159 [Mycoblastus sanguinarius]|nr:hypothetical protein [Mycoblastus sanguinarius]
MDQRTAAIAAYPKVQWQVIINPESGPGTTSYPTDSNYITGISNLNSYPNVITLGYVDTAYTDRAYSSVIADIDVYAEWASYAKANISIDGIFFDDVGGAESATNVVLTYYHNASAYAYANIPSAVTPVIFNPGGLGPTQLFEFCDTMVEFETPSSSYYNVTTIKTFCSDNLDQTAVIVYNTTATTNVESLVHTMSKYGVEAVYFDYGSCTSEGVATGCYDLLSLADLEQLAAAVMAG